MLNQNLLLTGDDGYNLTNSLRFRSSASAYLNRTQTTPTTATKWTYSYWVKRGTIGGSSVQTMVSGTGGGGSGIVFYNDKLWASSYSGGYQWNFLSAAVYRDTSAWYHIVVAYDSTQATDTNRVKIYVNNVQLTAFTTDVGATTYPSLNAVGNVGGVSGSVRIGLRDDSFYYLDGYLAEMYFVDGQQLTPSSFGSTNALTGVWQPAKYTGSYGTNGFYLPFTDNSALTTSSNVGLGRDYSGNGNYWTTNNISITAGSTYDSMTDVPTLTSATTANYAVLNPLDTGGTAPTNGNLTLTAGAAERGVRSTFSIPTTGLYYVEALVGTNQSGATDLAFGFVARTTNLAVNPSGIANGWLLYATSNTNITRNGTSTLAGAGAALVSGDVLQLAIDLANNKGWVGKNNTWFNGTTGTDGNPSTGANPTFTFSSPPELFVLAHGYLSTIDVNFGQRPFAYTPPTGFVALNTFNLPTSTIVKGGSVMTAYTWSGNSTEPRAFTDVGFKPDFYWSKVRNAGFSQHTLIDSVRGVNGQLASDTTDAEDTTNFAVKLDSFDSDGFTLSKGSNATFGYYQGNLTGRNYVGWMWQAGQGTTSSNTSGSITSTVSANPSAGFSVVTYTGTGSVATVGHGLGVAPKFIIAKSRNTAGTSWQTYHISTGATDTMYLNSTAATFASSVYWNNTTPTSTTFTLGAGSFVNTAGYTCVAYCWAEIAGYSAFGSYTGNGSSDGPFVFTGFRPKYVMFKRSDSIANWTVRDTARNPFNAANLGLFPNLSAAEDSTSGREIDILSNGFKIRGTDSDLNSSGGTYIYMAFAENPLKYALAR